MVGSIIMIVGSVGGSHGTHGTLALTSSALTCWKSRQALYNPNYSE
jgi:hypothetical protein